MILSEEDRIVAVLKNIPIFCINRTYSLDNKSWTVLIEKDYKFEFDNGYGASIITYADKSLIGGHDFELAVTKKEKELGYFMITYETEVTSDIERGDACYMHDLLCKIETLSDDRVNSADN